MGAPNFLETRGWSGYRRTDRAAIREYAESQRKAAVSCPPSLVLHLLDVIDAIEGDVTGTGDLGDPERNYFADHVAGVVEDIADVVDRLRGMEPGEYVRLDLAELDVRVSDLARTVKAD